MAQIKISVLIQICFLLFAQHHLTCAKYQLRQLAYEKNYEYMSLVAKHEGYVNITNYVQIQANQKNCDYLDIYGLLWISFESRGLPWISLDIPRNKIKNPGLSMDLLGYP